MLEKYISGPEWPPEGAQGGAMNPVAPLGTSLLTGQGEGYTGQMGRLTSARQGDV